MYLEPYIEPIIKLCTDHKVKSLYAFGSVLNDQFTKTSDVDLIIDLLPTDPIEYAETYFEFKFQLEDLLKRPVDLLEERGIRNPYFFKSISKTKQMIYKVD